MKEQCEALNTTIEPEDGQVPRCICENDGNHIHKDTWGREWISYPQFKLVDTED